MKRSYDSSISYLYSIGREDIIDKETRKKIPFSTRSEWRKRKRSGIIGQEYQYVGLEFIEKADLLKKIKAQKKILSTVARSRIMLADATKEVISIARDDRSLRFALVNSIEELRKHFGLARTLRWYNISLALYRQWLLESRFECSHSFTSLCLKRHPGQLNGEELRRMRDLLEEEEFICWPVCSVSYFAARNLDVTASLWTWYKYARVFNLKHKAVRGQKKTEGLKAIYPNEYLHADTTYYEIMEGTKICITFVSDNFSRKILGWNCSLGSVSWQNVRGALEKAFVIVAENLRAGSAAGKNAALVTDGGRENNNSMMHNFLCEISGLNVQHLVALKDIVFSNSQSEAINKIMKGRYLRRKHYASQEEFEKYLSWAVNDYNNKRPHHAHKGKTPDEVYFNLPMPVDLKKTIRSACRTRAEKNRATTCTVCKSDRCKMKKKSLSDQHL
jgi:putative transposase